MATTACWTPVRSCLASGSVSPKSAMSWRLPGRPSSISSTLRAPPSAHVSTSCNTKPIHDPPAENGPASHIAPFAHPQSLDAPVGSATVSRVAHLSELGSNAARGQFMAAFAEAVYEANEEPLHLVL